MVQRTNCPGPWLEVGTIRRRGLAGSVLRLEGLCEFRAYQIKFLISKTGGAQRDVPTTYQCCEVVCHAALAKSSISSSFASSINVSVCVRLVVLCVLLL